MNSRLESVPPSLNGLPGGAFPGESPSSYRGRLLVIGYGNELRGDDAAGPTVARAIADGELSHVSALAVPMLLPELVVEMAGAENVVFVDASLRYPRDRVRLSRVGPTLRQTSMSCAFSPEMMAGLCEILHGRSIKSWLLEIPASKFAFGDALSEATLSGIAQAVGIIRRWTRASMRRFSDTDRLDIPDR